MTLTKDPFWYGLGHYKDSNGNLWDVRSTVSTNKVSYINARPVDSHIIYDTSCSSGMQSYSCSWAPYFVKLQDSSMIKVKTAYEDV